MVIESSIIHCVIVSIFSGFIYGYNTGIVAGISKPAIEGFFNATFYDPEKKTCVKIKDHPCSLPSFSPNRRYTYYKVVVGLVDGEKRNRNLFVSLLLTVVAQRVGFVDGH